MKYVIELELTTGDTRYAQNRSVTFDYSFGTTKIEDAKRFDDIAQCHRWLKRNGFPVKGKGSMPVPYRGWWVKEVAA
jgi:hypothetical protein